MRTQRILPAVCFLLTLVALQAKDFRWAGRGTLSLETPDGWKVDGRDAAEPGYAFTGRPASPVAAFLQITVVAKPVSDEELPAMLQTSLQPYIEQSVEKEFRPIALRLHQGKGWYAELTDAALVGKPPVPDDYKVMRSALIALDAQTLVVATMQFDDPSSDAAGEMLAIVSSLRVAR